MDDSFKILAEHFSQDTGIEIIVTGDQSRIDLANKKIYLPENISIDMFDEVIATLLHESYHLKHTKGLKPVEQCNSPVGIIANILEDIRIDNKILKKYPNGSNLYLKLLKYLESKKPENTKLTREESILKRLVLESYGGDIFDGLKDNSTEVESFFKENDIYIKDLLKNIRIAKKTIEVSPFAKDLYKKLFNRNDDEEEKQEEQKKDLEKQLSNASDETDNSLREYRESVQNGEGKPARKDKFLKARDLQDQQRNVQKKLHELLRNSAQRQQVKDKEDFKKLGNMNNSGFSLKNLDNKDLTAVKKRHLTIEEELLDFIKNTQERRISTDDGKINANRLPMFFDCVNLFEQKPVDEQAKTRVFFMVDRSGSMQSYDKYIHAVESVSAIAKILELGIENYGLDLEYSVYGFDCETSLIKDFDQTFDPVLLERGLEPRGGTDPLSTIKLIEDIFPDKINTKEIVFFITDGDFDYPSYQHVKTKLTGKKKWIFIGIDINKNKNSEELFGKYNITDPSKIKEILSKAIRENT